MRTIGCLLCLVWLVSAGSVRAAWDPLSLSRWLPGKSAQKAEAETETARVPLVKKMTGSTKRLVSNTTGMLTPKKTTIKKSGTTAYYKAPLPPQEKPGFFKSLFQPEPPPVPKTIKEWMSLKQIHP
jgi:hypothetical protein